VRLVPAATFDDAQLAALFTAGYEGYPVPIAVDQAALRRMVEAWDIDLSRSRVAVDGDELVGIVQLGVRGERGWIGGLGVAPHARRRGVGRALMEAVLRVAPRRVGLEVLEHNEPALRLYESLGFVQVRVLEVWSLAADLPAQAARKVEPTPLGQEGLPWQRQDRSLPEVYERIEVDGAEALLSVGGERVSVLQLAARDEGAARAALVAARSRGASLHFLNVPAGDPASAALRSLGASLDLRQFELERDQRLMPLSVA
jgi:ribosomal protein S18 acetylase RimI-like enzyme